VFQSQASPVVSNYVPHVVACWPYHVIDIAHSAVGHSQSPDPLSGTCFRTNWDTPTVLSLHSDSHWRHSSSTSISVLQRIRAVTIMRYVNLHFTYLLTYSTNMMHCQYSTVDNGFTHYLICDLVLAQSIVHRLCCYCYHVTQHTYWHSCSLFVQYDGTGLLELLSQRTRWPVFS